MKPGGMPKWGKGLLWFACVDEDCLCVSQNGGQNRLRSAPSEEHTSKITACLVHQGQDGEGIDATVDATEGVTGLFGRWLSPDRHLMHV